MDILDKLYYGNINEYFNSIITTKESKKLIVIYDNLKQQLNSNEFKLFEQYIDFQDKINEKVYKEKYNKVLELDLHSALELFNKLRATS